MRKLIVVIVSTVLFIPSPPLLDVTSSTASAQDSRLVLPMECCIFRDSKAPSGTPVNLYNPTDGAVYGQATIDSGMAVRGTWSEGEKGGEFKGKYSPQPAQFDVTESLAFGDKDTVKIFSYAGSTRAQVKALATSQFLTRNVEAARFTYHGFVAYCVVAVEEEQRREAIRKKFIEDIRAIAERRQQTETK